MVQRVTGRSKLDTEKAIASLDKHWKGDRNCPVCQKNSWVVGDELVEMRPFHGGALVTGGHLYPLFAVTCDVCGHTLLFNAIVAGLVEGSE